MIKILLVSIKWHSLQMSRHYFVKNIEILTIQLLDFRGSNIIPLLFKIISKQNLRKNVLLDMALQFTTSWVKVIMIYPNPISCNMHPSSGWKEDDKILASWYHKIYSKQMHHQCTSDAHSNYNLAKYYRRTSTMHIITHPWYYRLK